jgi:hypothetical protein
MNLFANNIHLNLSVEFAFHNMLGLTLIQQHMYGRLVLVSLLELWLETLKM